MLFAAANSHHSMWGLDLDDVLEGPDCVPVIDPPDRCSMLVSLPDLTDAERQRERAAFQVDLEAERAKRIAEWNAGTPPRVGRRRRYWWENRDREAGEM